jgi:hypothetical protein
MAKYTELDLEMAFNAGRIVEGGIPELNNDGKNELFEDWLETYTEEGDDK